MKYKNYPVKLFTIFAIACLAMNMASAQAVQSGRTKGHFGIDGDVESNISRNGWNLTGMSKPGKNSDDWFKGDSAGDGHGIIDTLGSWRIRDSINLFPGSFYYTKYMHYPQNYVLDSSLLIDAIYGMDPTGSTDTIIAAGDFIGGPASWTLTQSTVGTGKSDIVDYASHVRRSDADPTTSHGGTAEDSLWMYLAMSFNSTNGQKVGTMELFVDELKYDRTVSPNKFDGYGTEGGRKAWRFNSANDVIVAGDMAIMWTYEPSTKLFTVEPVIWVADSNRNISMPEYKNPNNFAWVTTGSPWKANGSTGYGWQKILPKTGKEFAYGTVSAAGSKSNVYYTIKPGGSPTSANTFAADQMVEIGMNLTTLGVDPVSFTAINQNPCGASFRSIVYHTTTSGPFIGNMKDFVGPRPFWRTTEILGKGTDTLKCNKTTATLKIPGTHDLAFFQWSALPGTAQMGTINADSSMSVTKAGKYLVEYATKGCEIHKDTFVVLQDTTAPVAKWSDSGVVDTLMDGSINFIVAYGGDTTQSKNRMATNAATFGPHKSFIFDWDGPNGFNSNQLNVVATAYGIGSYYFTITETRNGCSSTTPIPFVFTPVEYGKFHCSKTPDGVQINWQTYSEINSTYFDIEKWNGLKYQSIGKVMAQGNSNQTVDYVFVDKKPSPGANVYRAALHSAGTDQISYSESCVTNINGSNTNLPFVFNVYPNPGAGEFTVTSALNASTDGTVFLYDMAGRLVKSEVLHFDATGASKIDLSSVKSGIYMLGMVNEDMPQTVRLSIK
ncbi:MAG: T9SS type A sorting domain-containing protein [Bacteroidetes bacterium]|nr:T9SS type A sorting domain-containing protein [Bacteroidota bacterium]